jgi:hypothetical protein
MLERKPPKLSNGPYTSGIRIDVYGNCSVSHAAARASSLVSLLPPYLRKRRMKVESYKGVVLGVRQQEKTRAQSRTCVCVHGDAH